MGQQSGDGLLRVLTDLANRGGLRFDVTLVVGGTLIAGHLVSGAMYFEETAAFIDASVDDDADSLSKGFRQMRDHYYAEGLLGSVADDLEQAADDADSPNAPSKRRLPVFIHLKETVVLNRHSESPIGFWRGRISEVQGWTVGRFSRSP